MIVAVDDALANPLRNRRISRLLVVDDPLQVGVGLQYAYSRSLHLLKAELVLR